MGPGCRRARGGRGGKGRGRGAGLQSAEGSVRTFALHPGACGPASARLPPAACSPSRPCSLDGSATQRALSLRARHSHFKEADSCVLPVLYQGALSGLAATAGGSRLCHRRTSVGKAVRRPLPHLLGRALGSHTCWAGKRGPLAAGARGTLCPYPLRPFSNQLQGVLSAMQASSCACACPRVHGPQVVRECQEQQAMLERSHGIKVQHIQREYQDFMEVRRGHLCRVPACAAGMRAWPRACVCERERECVCRRHARVAKSVCERERVCVAGMRARPAFARLCALCVLCVVRMSARG